jgi:hypothetical protein
MLTRIGYRAFSVLFFLLAILCWLIAAAAVAAQIGAQDLNVSASGTAFLSAVFAFWAHMTSCEAWRKGRYDPLYDAD